MPDWALRKLGAVRTVADGPRPCRVSLTDAKPGDELILVNYEHHPVASPYRMRFAIYVRAGEERFDAVDTVPEQLRSRTLAVRGFDAGGMMTGWELVEGVKLAQSADGKKMKFLRRIPLDPFTNTREWGKRSDQDETTSTSWGRQNVFDVYTKSQDKDADGKPYSEW